MRIITERNAQLIEEVMQREITELKNGGCKSLRVQNKIRLMQMALSELQTNKISKNGRIKNQQSNGG